MARVWSAFCGVLTVLALVTPALAQSTSVPVGVLVALTGDAAQFGKGELDAIRLAADRWNARGGVDGKQIELKIEDTATSHAKEVSAYKKLVDIDKLQFLLGPTWLDTFQAVVPLAERQHVLLLTPSAEGLAMKHGDPNAPMALTTYYSSRIEVLALLKALKAEGLTKLIATYSNEPYFMLVRDIVNQEAKGIGLEILEEQIFDMGASDFNSAMARWKLKKPDCLLLLQTDEGTVRAFLKARHQFMPETPAAGVHDFEGFFRNPGLRSLSGTFYETRFKVADKSFADEFTKRYGYAPTLTHPNAYDAANMLFEALSAGKTTGPEIRDYLLANEFNTVTFGKVRFTKTGMIEGGDVGVKKVLPGSGEEEVASK